VAAAVGEGAAVVSQIHSLLAQSWRSSLCLDVLTCRMFTTLHRVHGAARNASKLAAHGCICGSVANADMSVAATNRQIAMPARTSSVRAIRSSRDMIRPKVGAGAMLMRSR